MSDLINSVNLQLEIPEKSTIAQVLIELEKKIGKEFKKRILADSDKINDYVILVLNGKDIRILDGLNTVLKDKDTISFLPALAGG